MNTNPSSPEPTNESGDGSSGFLKSTDLFAPSPEQPSKNSTSENTNALERTSYEPLSIQGGDLNSLVNSVTNRLTKNEGSRAVINNFFIKNSRGFGGALAMQCKGRNCPFLFMCALNEAKEKLPVGEQCPLEQSLVQLWVNKHLISLGIDDFASPEFSFDMDILYEMASHELIKWRLAGHLSQEGNLMEERQVSASPQGDPIFAKVMTPLLEEMDRHTRITLKLREALLATRKVQAQAGRDLVDPSKKGADLMDKVRKLVKSRREHIKDADYDELEDE